MHGAPMRLAGARLQRAQSLDLGRRGRRDRLDVRADAERPADCGARFLDRRIREQRGQLELLATVLRGKQPEIRDDLARTAAVRRVRKPALVRKSSFGTKLRGVAFNTTNVCLACAAISGAPPAPGSRVDGAS